MSEFPIVPPASSPLIVLAIVCVLLLALVVVLAVWGFSMGHEKFQISSEGLKISAFLYGRSIPARDLDVSRARSVDLNMDSGYQLARKTNGASVPGYQSGWFSMANGGKALAFVTDEGRVVCIPTRQDYTVLLSVENPDQFLRTLRDTIR